MPPTLPLSYLLQRNFADADDLAAEARQWDLDFRQLECGRFHGDLLQFGSGGVQIGDARFCRALKQQGMPPPGMRTIAIPVHGRMRLVWRGRVIDGESVMVFPRDSELSSVSDASFHVYTCSFPEELLATFSETLGLGDVDDLLAGRETVRCGLPDITRVRRCLQQLCQSARSDSANVTGRSFAEQLTKDLPARLLTAIARGRGDCSPVAGPNRMAAVDRAERFIERFARDNVKVRDVCQAVGVSERSLEYAFVERFGVGPKDYLSTFRLHAVRRRLRAADPKTTKVADVANAWGYWHMGQFAADYRRRFGELPSETLRCSAYVGGDATVSRS